MALGLPTIVLLHIRYAANLIQQFLKTFSEPNNLSKKYRTHFFSSPLSNVISDMLLKLNKQSDNMFLLI